MRIDCDSYVEIGGVQVPACNLQVIDHRGVRLRGVIWCDTETGEYEAYDYKHGFPVITNKWEFKTYRRKVKSLTVRVIDPVSTI